MLLLTVAGASAAADPADCGHFLVDTETMREAMGGIEGYDTAASTNQSRFAVAGDQTQVNWSRVAKLFAFNALSTITPDGIAERGVPQNRKDLQELAEKLETGMEVEARDAPPRACDVED